MPRALITGAAGFLGSHLCDAFLDRGIDVVGMDNLVTGDLRNVAHLEGNPGFQMVIHDVSQYIHLSGPIDYVLHFASPASPVDYPRIPIPTLKVGSHGTHNCLGLALAKGARFLLASTSEIYGDPLEHPQKESYFGNVDSISVRGVYDEAKRFAESITMAYHRYHDVETRIVRIFNTYGPRMRVNDGRVLPQLIGQALTGRPMSIHGDGKQTRSFCYVDDLIDGIMRLLMSDEAYPVNIGNPREMTILEFAEALMKAVGVESEILFDELPTGDPKVRKPDITRAREILGWEPKVGLEEGLALSVPFFRERVLGEA